MLQFLQLALTYTLPFLAVLTLVVTVHELGHLLVARLCGVAVDRFSIGFGRPLWSWHDRSGMEWRISWLPIGGYVKFSGDENVASVPDEEDLSELRQHILAEEGPAALKRYFHFKPLWQRALVVAAGPAANFVLAIVIFAAFAMAVGQITVTPRVAQVVPGSPAAAAGFKPGDVVSSVDGRRITDFEQLSRYVKLRPGDSLRVDVERAGSVVPLTVTPVRKVIDDGPGSAQAPVGYIGLMASATQDDVKVTPLGPVAALDQGVRQTADIVGVTLEYMGRIVSGRASGQQFSGPLGIAGLAGQAASEATRSAPNFEIGAARLTLTLVRLAAFISVAVGFANLLPIPVLDGGHLLFYAYEAVARRPLTASIQAAGYRVGFALLISLMLFVTFNDLQRYRVFHLIGRLFS